MAMEDQVGDPVKREKLKKMIEGLDAKGMDSMMNQMLNYGGGSTYKMYGDTDPKDISFEQGYTSEGGVEFDSGDFEGTGGQGRINWANLLIDTANQQGVQPPEKFWFDDQVYDLNAVEVPIYETEDYQVPNPLYQAPQQQQQQPSKGSPGKGQAPPSKGSPGKGQAPPPPQPQYNTLQRQVQTGTRWELSDVGQQTF